jgi:tetratricopeptide (TPR) repeat protein
MFLARYGVALAVLVFLVLALALYIPFLSQLPTRADELPTMDDRPVFFSNPVVRADDGGLLTAPFFADTFRPIWRPLTSLTLRWNWLLWPEGRAQAIVVNVLLLVIGAGLAVALLRRLGVSTPIAASGVALILVHPVMVESVMRLAGRSELLAQALLLAAFVGYVTWAQTGPASSRPVAIARWIFWGLLFLLALTAKENALLLPFLVLGYELVASPVDARPDRTRRWITVGMISLLVVSSWAGFRAGVIRGWPHELKRNPTPDYVAALTDGERRALALSLPGVYVAMIVCAERPLPNYGHLLSRSPEAPPIELGKPRTFGVHTSSDGEVAAGCAVLAAGLLLFIAARRRWPTVALGGWWFSVTLLAVLPLLKTNGHVASGRHLFLPLLGLLMILGPPIEKLLRRGAGAIAHRRAMGVGVLSLVVLILLGVAARPVARAWTEHYKLMAYLKAHAPRTPEEPLYRGMVAIKAGDYAGAGEQIERSISLFPRNPGALLNLGLIRAQQGNSSIAARVLGDAAVVAALVHPGTRLESRAHMALGAVRMEQDLDIDAHAAFLRAIEADSTNIDALIRAGMLEIRHVGRARDGIRHLRSALELDHAGLLGPLGEEARELADRAERTLQRMEAREGPHDLLLDAEPDTLQPGEGVLQRE